MFSFTKLECPSDVACVVRNAWASRFEFDRFMFPLHDKRHDLRLSVESSALFTLKNDKYPDRLICRLLSSLVRSLVIEPRWNQDGHLIW